MAFNVKKRLAKTDAEEAKAALVELLTKLTNPAFGALPKREIDLVVFEALRDLELVKKDASLYELMSDLRITRSKAANLLFDLEIRSDANTEPALDESARNALKTAKFTKDDNYFVFEVETPLVRAHIRERVRELGHLTDTSFNQSLIRMSLNALTDLMDKILADATKEDVRRALEKAGAPEPTTFKSVMKGALKQVAKKAVGKAADGLVEEAGAYISPLLDGAGEKIAELWTNLFDEGTETGG